MVLRAIWSILLSGAGTDFYTFHPDTIDTAENHTKTIGTRYDIGRLFSRVSHCLVVSGSVLMNTQHLVGFLVSWFGCIVPRSSFRASSGAYYEKCNASSKRASCIEAPGFRLGGSLIPTIAEFRFES